MHKKNKILQQIKDVSLEHAFSSQTTKIITREEYERDLLNHNTIDLSEENQALDKLMNQYIKEY